MDNEVRPTPSGNPLATEDGRPFVRWSGQSNLWHPKPPRHGDPVYRDGTAVGTVYGDLDVPGAGCIETFATASA